MTDLRTSARTTGTPTQTVRTVARSELAKLLGVGGLRVWLIVSVVLGLVSGIGMIVLTTIEEVQETLAMTVADSLSLGPLVAMFTLGLGVAGFVPREVSDGTVVTAKYLVPRTRTLFAGRLLAWFVVGGALAAVCTVVALPLAWGIGSLRPSGLGETLLATLLAVVVPALTIEFVHVGAIVLRRGAYVVAVGLMLFIIVPLVAAIGQAVPVAWVARLGIVVSKVMIGPLVVGAMSVPAETSGLVRTTLLSLLGLLLWVGGTGVLAYRRFASAGYGES